MKLFYLLTFSALVAVPLIAEETRQLDAHEHGVGELNIAFEGRHIAIELHAPGADIVGFEHPAVSAADRAAIEAAIATLENPLDLFVLPVAADCSVVSAHAHLDGEESHEEREHHDGDDDHADHGTHEHHHHHGEDETGQHTEFHVEYALTCRQPDAVTQIEFTYFNVFENARELEIQIVSDQGATKVEIERDAPVLDLRGML